MKDNTMKKQNYIIAALFTAAALMLFMPLISIHADYVEWSGSMKTLIEYANQLSKVGSFMGDFFSFEDEYPEMSAIAENSVLLYAPYVFAFLAALFNLFAPKKYGRVAGILIGLINIAAFVGIALWGNSCLESILGYAYYETEISIWKVLGIGFWLFLILQAAAVFCCILSLGQNEKTTVPEISESRSAQNITISEQTALQAFPDPAPTGIIQCIRGEYSGMQMPIGVDETIVIGRDARECNLVVSGAKVSRRHCAISWFSKTNRYTLTDFSSNGTFYQDGKRIPPNTTVEIMPGTLIYLGDEENSFQIG